MMTTFIWLNYTILVARKALRCCSHIASCGKLTWKILLPLSAASFSNLHVFYSVGLRDQHSTWLRRKLSKGKSIQFYSSLLKLSLFWSQLSVHIEALSPDTAVAPFALQKSTVALSTLSLKIPCPSTLHGTVKHVGGNGRKYIKKLTF